MCRTDPTGILAGTRASDFGRQLRSVQGQRQGRAPALRSHISSKFNESKQSIKFKTFRKFGTYIFFLLTLIFNKLLYLSTASNHSIFLSFSPHRISFFFSLSVEKIAY